MIMTSCQLNKPMKRTYMTVTWQERYPLTNSIWHYPNLFSKRMCIQQSFKGRAFLQKNSKQVFEASPFYEFVYLSQENSILQYEIVKHPLASLPVIIKSLLPTKAQRKLLRLFQYSAKNKILLYLEGTTNNREQKRTQVRMLPVNTDSGLIINRGLR